MGSQAMPEKKKSKAWIWGLVGCGCLFVLIVMVGIIAAIAIPSLLRARIAANEAGVIGDTRSIISAEVAYQAASGGKYGSLECLAAPASCIRSYAGTPFIDASLATKTRQGYRRELNLSYDDEHFAYTAEPAEPGKTGTRGFCGDETGVILQKNGSAAPGIRNNVCDATTGSPI
jgi:type IV pilus assembly protein PilA